MKLICSAEMPMIRMFSKVANGGWFCAVNLSRTNTGNRRATVGVKVVHQGTKGEIKWKRNEN